MIQKKDNTIRKGCEHFPREISSLDELPEAVRAAIQQHETNIRQIIFVPSHEYPVQRSILQLDLPFRWRKTPHYTLVFGAEQILIVEESAQFQKTLVIPLADLLSIRLVSVLLYMYLELTWKVNDSCETVKIEFSAVGERMMKRELDRARTVMAQRCTAPLGPFQEASITHFPYKFQTYTYGDLLPEENIWLGVYEPKIHTAGRYLRSYLSPNRVFVLTNYHLLVLEDRNRRLLEADLSEYWMERCFYPRTHIRDIAFDIQPNVTWMNVILDVQNDVRFPLLEPRAAALREVFGEWLISAHQPKPVA